MSNSRAGSKLDTRWPLWVIWPVDTSWIDIYAQPRGPEITEPIVTIHADKPLDPETAKALGELAAAAVKAIEDGVFDDPDFDAMADQWATGQERTEEARLDYEEIMALQEPTAPGNFYTGDDWFYSDDEVKS